MSESPPENKPHKLSEAILEGSKDTEQLYGGFLKDNNGPTQATGSGEAPQKKFIIKPSHILKISDSWMYDSFIIRKGDKPQHQTAMLFTVPIGAGKGVNGASKGYIDTNNLVAIGVMPLGTKFQVHSIQIILTEPTKYKVKTWINGCVLLYNSPLIGTEVMGPCHMFLKPYVYKKPMLFEAGLDVRFEIQWHDKCQVPLMEYLDQPNTNDFISCYVVLTGIKIKSIA